MCCNGTGTYAIYFQKIHHILNKEGKRECIPLFAERPNKPAVILVDYLIENLVRSAKKVMKQIFQLNIVMNM